MMEVLIFGIGVLLGAGVFWLALRVGQDLKYKATFGMPVVEEKEVVVEPEEEKPVPWTTEMRP